MPPIKFYYMLINLIRVLVKIYIQLKFAFHIN